MPITADTDRDEKTSALDDKALVKRIRANLKIDKSGREIWAKEATTCYDFTAGNQWTEDEEKDYHDLERAPIKFNRIEPIVNVVCGMEVGSRKEVRYLPRENSDGPKVEIWNAAGDWARDGCAAEDEESEQFNDAVISGLGWVETRLDYDQEPDGQIIIERIDPFEVFPDARAKKRNLEDMRRVTRVQKRPLDWVKDQWPDKEDEIEAYDFLSRTEEEIISNGGSNRVGQKRYDGESHGASARGDTEVEVIEHQYLESETYYRVQDPQSRGFKDMPEADTVKLRAQMLKFGMQLEAVKMRRDVAYRCFVAGDILLERSKCPDPTCFTLQAITGKRDRKKKTWYGLVRPLLDPQRLQNKTLILMLDILANMAKGGIIAEKNAVDPDQLTKFNETIADYRQTTWVANGALSQRKVQPKNPGQMPTVLPQLLEFAANGFAQVSGVSPELMGMTQIDQPAALEVTRKQSGFTMLATLFDSQRRYRKKQGASLLYLINEFLADGRLIRIVGKQGEQYLPLLKEPEALRYDVVVDDAPTSPNERERVWGLLQTLLPMLKGMGIPIPPEMIEYLPLPASVIDIWNKFAPTPEKQQDEQTQKQLAIGAASAKIARDNAAAAKDNAAAQHTVTTQPAKDYASANKDQAQADAIHADTQVTRAAKLIDSIHTVQIADREAAGNAAIGIPPGFSLRR